VSQANIRRLIVVGLGLGLSAVAAYLNTHGDTDTFFLWLGAFFCFMTVMS